MIRCLKLVFSCKHPALEGENDAAHGIRVSPEQAESLTLPSDKECAKPLSTCGLSNTETTDINEGSSFQSERVQHQGNKISDAFNGATGKEEDVSYQKTKDTEDVDPVANDAAHGIRASPEQAESLTLPSDKECAKPLSTCGLSNTETTDKNEGSSFQSERVQHQGDKIADAFNGATGKEEDVSYQKTKDTEDLDPVANENEPVNTMPKDTSRIIGENRRLREQVMRLSSRVALELSSEETGLENVTSKSRPSMTAAKYVELHSNEWLNAKDVLDAHHTEDKSWCVKLLCRTIQIGVDTAGELLKTSEQRVSTLLKTISRRGMSSCPSFHEGEGSLAETVESLPPSLSHEIHQYIKSKSETFDASVIAERICLQLTSEFPDNFPEVKEKEAVQLFIKACAEVAWQIVIQQPPMYLSCSPTKFDEECHERCWDNFDMAPGQLFDLEYIWPILYDSEKKNRVLKQGIVRMTPRPIKTKTERKVYVRETHL